MIRYPFVYFYLLFSLFGCQTVNKVNSISVVGGSDYPLNQQLEKAKDAYHDGDIFEAEKLYLNLLSSHPRIEEAWFHLGNIYFRSGRYQASVNAYESVLKIDRQHERAWYNLSLSRISQAIETIDYSLEILPIDSAFYAKNLLLKKSLIDRLSEFKNQNVSSNKAPDLNLLNEDFDDEEVVEPVESESVIEEIESDQRENMTETKEFSS